MRYEQLSYEEIYQEVPKLLSERNIIGWYQGRSEIGPRALGNRSILLDPRDEINSEYLNTSIKQREWYRPFAPVILKSEVNNWFEQIEESKYMLNICKFKKGMGEKVPAVCHKDYTGRVQTVTKEDNEYLYNLLCGFQYLTDIPMLLNTSFNRKGEPIVETPEDAVNCFHELKLDYLVLKNFLIIR